MKYLVTGGAGFIGSHIVEELVKRGEEVTVIDNLSAGKLQNIAHIKDKVNFIRGDIRNFKLLKKIMKNIDYVSHQAAKRAVPASFGNPEGFNDVNINGTFNVLRAAQECGVKRVVFASSSSVYGDSGKFPQKESFTLKPKSPYAITKIVGELYCKYFYDEYGLETVSLRYFNVLGPRQDLKSKDSTVVPIFIDRVFNNKQPIIYGDGKQSRDFVYVGDVVKANFLVFKANKLKGETINICSGVSISILKLLEEINLLLGKDIKPKFEEERNGDIFKTQGDIGFAGQLIGYEVDVGFKKGLRKLLKTLDINKKNI